jgi:hypothetical protein
VRSEAATPAAGLLLAVLGGMVLTGFLSVMLGMNVVTVRHVGMMTGLLMVTRFVMLGGRPVVLGGVIVVLSGFVVVLRGCF